MPSPQPAIVLGAINSTYQHCSIGIRYLYANLGPLKPQCQLKEWTIKESPLAIAEDVLKLKPRIVGFGVYIWNVDLILQVCTTLKSLDPELFIVLGGPEVSYEVENNPLRAASHFIIQGEADIAFRELCEKLLTEAAPPLESKIIPAVLPEIKSLMLPYELFTDEDIKNRIIYVEASRGCPYKCEYCLSSLDKSVRSFDLDLFLLELEKLIDRGAREFKFVDRTFNLSPTTSTRILKFFLSRIELGFFLHFEMVPDRLPLEIRELIAQFPAGSLQFEVGIQTLNPEVARNVSRKNDLVKVQENFQYINEFTNVHTHADLIVGLPGETLESFGIGFDQLMSWGPHEIQVGILKRLKGTPIVRHEKTFSMTYSQHSPFQILKTSTLSFAELQLMNKFSKFWDLIFNNGEFPNFCSWMKEHSTTKLDSKSLFNGFLSLVEFLSKRHPRAHSISLIHLSESLYEFMLAEKESKETTFEIIKKDFCEGPKKRDIPPFLKRAHFEETRKRELAPDQANPLVVVANQKNRRQLNHASR